MTGTATIPIERYDELKGFYDSFQEGGISVRYRDQRIMVITKDEYVNEITKENTELKEARDRDYYYYGLTAIQDLLRYEEFTIFNAFSIIRKIKKILYQ